MDLFDRSREYDEMLEHGLRLSGENRRYFMEGRVKDLRKQLGENRKIDRILDFGCGTGETSAYLASVFPGTEVMGVDTAENAIEHARRNHASDRVHFENVQNFFALQRFDLCYTNGVFHHIDPSERKQAIELIYNALVTGGRFALMENNPWNPGARMVMRRIPFDRDAIPLNPIETRRLLLSAGFELSQPARFLFYFPRILSAMRFLEPLLARLPLGAQYYFLATRT